MHRYNNFMTRPAAEPAAIYATTAESIPVDSIGTLTKPGMVTGTLNSHVSSVAKVRPARTLVQAGNFK